MSIVLALVQFFTFSFAPVAAPERDARSSRIEAAPSKAAQRQVHLCNDCR